MDKKQITEAVEEALKGKGKRKFPQTVEAIFNFRGIDVSKPENRINLDVILPKGRGKEVPVVVFAESNMAMDAKNAGAAKVVGKSDIAKMRKEKKELKKLSKNSEFIAAPQLMIEVGKNLGQVLGSAGKLPKPVIGNVENAIKQAKARVRIQTRGKYLPTVQCAIGSENMNVNDIAENFESVYEKLKDKVGLQSIASAYVKLTMGQAVKIGAVKEKEGEKKG
ncbi:MAG: 50S ribosomal protein L1 [Candidatus Micrarchaeota archaeon]